MLHRQKSKVKAGIRLLNCLPTFSKTRMICRISFTNPNCLFYILKEEKKLTRALIKPKFWLPAKFFSMSSGFYIGRGQRRQDQSQPAHTHNVENACLASQACRGQHCISPMRAIRSEYIRKTSKTGAFHVPTGAKFWTHNENLCLSSSKNSFKRRDVKLLSA